MRQLGSTYVVANPVSVIISNRLVQLQQSFGGMELACSVFRSNRRQYKKTIDRHVINLMETYGTLTVADLYQQIYGKAVA